MKQVDCCICGAPLVYFDQARELVCALCGRHEEGRSACAIGHYVCDACHRAKGTDFIAERCRATTSDDPIALATEIMRDSSLCQHGPEHHVLVGSVLLTAYRNAGGAIELDEALAELCSRASQVPGGACGYWGACGAAVSAGQFWSIVSGATPLSREPWAQCQLLTSRILARLASFGGPRCCKRSVFTAIIESVAFAREQRGIAMSAPELVHCPFFARNAECIKAGCPYYPADTA